MYEKFEELLSETHKSSYLVAKESGVTQTVLSNWKNGKCKPSLTSIAKLAKYFNKPIEYFLE